MVFCDCSRSPFAGLAQLDVLSVRVRRFLVAEALRRRVSLSIGQLRLLAWSIAHRVCLLEYVLFLPAQIRLLELKELSPRARLCAPVRLFSFLA